MGTTRVISVSHRGQIWDGASVQTTCAKILIALLLAGCPGLERTRPLHNMQQLCNFSHCALPHPGALVFISVPSNSACPWHFLTCFPPAGLPGTLRDVALNVSPILLKWLVAKFSCSTPTVPVRNPKEHISPRLFQVTSLAGFQSTAVQPHDPPHPR